MPAVLVVDDEEYILYGLRKALSRRGWEVLEASSVDEARRIFNMRPVEVVLTDIRMEGESGLMFLQEVKATRPETRVVVMTARGSEEMEKEVLALGAEAYVEKPFDLNYLDSVLKKVLKSRGFKGVVQELSLIDILQLLAYESGTAKIEVSSAEGKGAIFVKDGRVIHAKFEDLEGQDAFDRIMGLEGGSFSVRRGELPPKETMDQALDALLLKVVASKDETVETTSEDTLTLDNVDEWSFTQAFGLAETASVPEEVKERARGILERLKALKNAQAGGVFFPDYDYTEKFGEVSVPEGVLKDIDKVLKGLNREDMFCEGEPSLYFRSKGDVLIWVETKTIPLVVLRVETGKVF